MTNHVLSRVFPAFAFVAVLMSASAAQASTVLVTNEGGIANNGLLSWGTLGTDGTMITNPFTMAVAGISGLQMTGSQAQNPFEVRQQGSTWGGNFGGGEQLLASDGANAPMTFRFNDGIAGFGAQIQANFYGAFTAVISAFDVNGVLLGQYTRQGLSNGMANDSAIFIGILSNARDIRSIVLSVPQAETEIQNFAINSPRIQGAPGVESMPEPASMVLLGTGIAGLVARRMRRRSS